MKKIFAFLSGNVFDKVGNIIDDLVTSKEEKLVLKNQLEKLFLDAKLKLQEMQTSIIISESKGNFLQRSWRPILMLSFGFIVLYSKFIAPAFGLPNAVLESDFWDLLKLGVGGYVVGRSAEKITETIKKDK